MGFDGGSRSRAIGAGAGEGPSIDPRRNVARTIADWGLLLVAQLDEKRPLGFAAPDFEGVWLDT